MTQTITNIQPEKAEKMVATPNANNEVATVARLATDQDDFIPQIVYDNLPSFLKDCCNLFNDKYERDVFLYGALTVLGGSFHRLYAFNDVDKKKVAANLLALIVAPPVSGKGALNYSKRLIDFIKVTFKTRSRKFGTKGNGKLQIPANNSSSGLIEMLNNNEGVGIIVESEIDTLVNATKQDWGNYSDVLRNSFENESCSLNRKSEKEPVEINNVKLSLAISGTPNQFKTLMNSAENGLFSRGCYYVFRNNDPKLKCFDRINTQIDLDKKFEDLAKKANDFYELHLSFESIKVVFSREQLSKIQDALQDEYDGVNGHEELRANIARSFIIVQKIASLLVFLEECENGKLAEKLPCSDKALNTALEFSLTSLRHSYKAYDLLPKKSSMFLSNSQQKLFHSLPDEFTRREAVSKSKDVGLKERSIDYCIQAYKKKGMIEEIEHGKFKKAV